MPLGQAVAEAFPPAPYSEWLHSGASCPNSPERLSHVVMDRYAQVLVDDSVVPDQWKIGHGRVADDEILDLDGSNSTYQICSLRNVSADGGRCGCLAMMSAGGGHRDCLAKRIAGCPDGVDLT